MMEDYEAINHKAKLTTRQQIMRDPNIETTELLSKIQKQTTKNATGHIDHQTQKRAEQEEEEEEKTKK